MIEKTAIIHPTAKIHKDVSIGPYSVIGQDVSIGSGTIIGSHVVIKGATSIGSNNKIYHFSSIGEDPQDKKFNQDDQNIINKIIEKLLEEDKELKLTKLEDDKHIKEGLTIVV